MKKLTYQDMLDLVDGAAIFSAGGGGSPEEGYRIADSLASEGFIVELIPPSEVPDDARVVNFACVGATTVVDYDSNAALKTLKTLEEYAGFSVFATIPVELGGFNTLTAIDVAARRGVPVVDADGAGRSVPEIQLKVYTIDNIALAPMIIADLHGRNIVIVTETISSMAGEQIARALAAQWNNSAYTARRILTGVQVKTSPIQLTLSRAIQIGRLLRKAVEPVKAILRETGSYELFEGIVDEVEKKTDAGFTFINIKLHGTNKFEGTKFELKVKNEVLASYRNGKLVALAPDIITPVNPETSKCVTAERIEKKDKLMILGLPAPQKWRTVKGLELWQDTLQRAHIHERYKPIEESTAPS